MLLTGSMREGDQDNQVSTDYPGAFVFDLRLSPDNLTLFLNGEAILPRARAYLPAYVRAPQVGLLKTGAEHRPVADVGKSTIMDLAYYIDSPDTTSRTSIYNTKYNPRIHIDILRASIPKRPGHIAPLSSDEQETIWIWLEDLSEHLPGTPYAQIPLRIKRVELAPRWPKSHSGGTTTYRSLKSLGGCYLWSWLCADIDEYPYYEYVYPENFDEYGKKGSMRHFLTQRWGNMVNLLGYWRAVILLAVCGSMVLSPFVYSVYRGAKSVFEMYQNRIKEVDDWVADEEIEEWLESDRDLEDFEFDEKEEIFVEKEGEKPSVDKPLPPPPPHAEDGKDLITKS